MAAIENENIYGLHIRESATDGSDFGSADADYRKVYVGEDGDWHFKDSSGVVTFGHARHGARAIHSTTQTVATVSSLAPIMDTDTYDTDNFHFTSEAALTGTVSKTATSATITGSGTSFTTELTVNQVISIPGTATEIGVVKTITNNTSLVLWQTMANSASGQTATRRSAFMAIPAGFGGLYSISGGVRWATVQAAIDDYLSLGFNEPFVTTGANYIVRNSYRGLSAATVNIISVATEYVLSAGDYVGMYFRNNENNTVTITNAGLYSPFLSLAFLGS